MQRFVLSKFKKTEAILRKERLVPFIPETRKLTESSLQAMLDKYGMVYVKPDKGTFGNGVVRIEKTKEGGIQYQAGMTVHRFTNYSEMFRELKTAIRLEKRTYLVQRGIQLLTYKGRRFDIRVLVQKSPEGRWETTGLIGRAAHPRRIVTNYHKGGQLHDVGTLLRENMTEAEAARLNTRMSRLGTSVARQLDSVFPGLKEIGLDVAIDPDRRPWILEVNTCPDPYIFKHLADKSIFRKVARYARAYGRIK